MHRTFWILGLLVLAIFCPRADAFVIIVSNRADSTHLAAPVADSQGLLLPVNQLGNAAALTLPAGSTPAGVAAQCGLPQLWSYATTFGPAIRVGPTAAGVVEGELLQDISGPAAPAWQGKTIFFFFFNAATLAQATEVLLLEFPTKLFQPGTSGLFHFTSRVHLANATVHLGTRMPDGSLRTAPTRYPCYPQWIQAALPTGTVAQRAQAADADGDGVSNLLEYAAGTNPALPDAANAQSRLFRNPDHSVTFAWPQADLPADTQLVPLTRTDLMQAYQTISGPIATAPSQLGLPPGVRWCSVTYPAASTRRFFAVRVTGPP